MKLSAGTKLKASAYIESLKKQVKSETGCEIPTRIFSPLRQYYEHKLHELERADILNRLKTEALDLGYILIKK